MPCLTQTACDALLSERNNLAGINQQSMLRTRYSDPALSDPTANRACADKSQPSCCGYWYALWLRRLAHGLACLHQVGLRPRRCSQHHGAPSLDQSTPR